jgi:hypothetical protein
VEVKLFKERKNFLLHFGWGSGMYLFRRFDYRPTLNSIWVCPLMHDGDDDHKDVDDDTNTQTSRHDASGHDNNDDDNDDDSQNDIDIDSHDTFTSSTSSGDSSSPAPSNVGGNHLHLAIPTSNPVQPSSKRNAFGSSDPLQQRISSSDSSSLIGLRRNPERNAHAKANSYEIGDDSSEASWKQSYHFQFRQKCQCQCQRLQFPNAQLVPTKSQVVFRG